MDSARLSVRVHPGARRDALIGRRGAITHVGLAVPAGGGDANRLLIALLAHRLRVDPGQISIVSGAGQRVKQLRIQGLTQAGLDRRLDAAGAASRGRRRALAVGIGAVAVSAAAIVLASGSGLTPGHRAQRHAGAISATAPPATVRRGTRPAGHSRPRSQPAPTALVPRRALADPGRLPQTAGLPSAATQEFAVRMRGLWAAISGAPVARARAAFFPETAYAQLKSVGDPVGDFENRLYYDYRLDIDAAHTLLGSAASSSRLIETSAVAAYAHWVAPGVCDNRVGYYELPNARLVYSQAGQVRSLGIASMISWRGVWYVVHLGAILRGSAGGMVDAPSLGPGVSVGSSTC